MGSPIRVFIVEDSPLILKRIIEDLHSLGGFDVAGFAEAEDAAVAAIVEAKPDMVITDIRLKKGNGIEVVRQLRQKQFAPRPQIYVLSNYNAAEYRRQCELAGADDFFDKSAEYERLLDTLRNRA